MNVTGLRLVKEVMISGRHCSSVAVGSDNIASIVRAGSGFAVSVKAGKEFWIPDSNVAAAEVEKPAPVQGPKK